MRNPVTHYMTDSCYKKMLEIRNSLPKTPMKGTNWLVQVKSKLHSVHAKTVREGVSQRIVADQLDYVIALVQKLESTDYYGYVARIAETYRKSRKTVDRDVRLIRTGQWSKVVFRNNFNRAQSGNNPEKPRAPRRASRPEVTWAFRALRSDGAVTYHRTRRAAYVNAANKGFDVVELEEWNKPREEPVARTAKTEPEPPKDSKRYAEIEARNEFGHPVTVWVEIKN